MKRCLPFPEKGLFYMLGFRAVSRSAEWSPIQFQAAVFVDYLINVDVL